MQKNNCFSSLSKELYVLSEKKSWQINSLKCFLYIIFNEPTIFISDYLCSRNISRETLLKKINDLDPSISLIDYSFNKDIVDYLSYIFSKCEKDLRNDVRKENLLNFLLKNSSNCRDFCDSIFDCEDLIKFLDDIGGSFLAKKESLESLSYIYNNVGIADFSDEKYVKFNESEFIKDNDDTFSYLYNITDEVRNCSHHPAIGRWEEISKVVHILNKKNKPNCILIGEAGVGKTAIIEGLACDILNETGEIGRLKGKEIYSLNICQLISGTSFRGQAEEKISKMLNFLESRDDAILFIDEIHMIVGAGGTSNRDSCDLSNILKPYLSRGKIICIGATTEKEYFEYIYPDPALERRFSILKIKEPSVNSVKMILDVIKEDYERYYGIKYGKNSIKYIISICENFLNNRKYPDKAIDILDSYGSYLKLHSLPANKKSFYSFCLFYLTVDEQPSLGFLTEKQEDIKHSILKLIS